MPVPEAATTLFVFFSFLLAAAIFLAQGAGARTRATEPGPRRMMVFANGRLPPAELTTRYVDNVEADGRPTDDSEEVPALVALGTRFNFVRCHDQRRTGVSS